MDKGPKAGDGSLELPAGPAHVQIGDEIRLEDGVLEFRYMAAHEACQVTIRIDDQTHAGVVLDSPMFALLAAFVADPQRTLKSGAIFKLGPRPGGENDG